MTHVAMQLVHWYQQKGESLQEFNFEFSECIKAVMNCKPKDITVPLTINMYAQKLLIPQLVLKQSDMCSQCCKKLLTMHIKREFLLVGGTQQMELDLIMSMDMPAANDPGKQERLDNITCFRWRQIGHYRP